MDLTKCFGAAAGGGNWIGKCVPCHIAVCVFAEDSRPAAHIERQENREGRYLQFYYYFNGFLYHSGIALSNALGP